METQVKVSYIEEWQKLNVGRRIGWIKTYSVEGNAYMTLNVLVETAQEILKEMLMEQLKSSAKEESLEKVALVVLIVIGTCIVAKIKNIRFLLLVKF